MTAPAYQQFCGIAHAFEIIGAPWAALVVRDLLIAPKTAAELHETLPRLGHDALAARLTELEDAGVLCRTGESRYALTAYGRDLEPILLALGRWGARTLGDPGPGDLFSIDMAILALRGAFRPEAASGLRVSFEVRFGPIVVGARVEDGVLTVREGELPDADLSMASPVLLNLMAGDLTPTDALWLGLIDAKGDPSMITTFVQVFHVPPSPDRGAP